jgi:hypothetical protein
MDTTKTSQQQQSKADFVRSLPKNLSTKEVVAKGKQAGIKLGEDYVYKVRSRERAKTSKRVPTAALSKQPQGVRPESSARGINTGKSVAPYEPVFARAVVDLGFEQAQALLARVRDRILRVAAS